MTKLTTETLIAALKELKAAELTVFFQKGPDGPEYAMLEYPDKSTHALWLRGGTYGDAWGRQHSRAEIIGWVTAHFEAKDIRKFIPIPLLEFDERHHIIFVNKEGKNVGSDTADDELTATLLAAVDVAKWLRQQE